MYVCGSCVTLCVGRGGRCVWGVGCGGGDCCERVSEYVQCIVCECESFGVCV